MVLLVSEFARINVTPDQINNIQVNDVVGMILKWLFLIGFALYILFALLAIRQIEIMSNTVVTPLSPKIRLVGYLNLCVAIAGFIFTYLYLR